MSKAIKIQVHAFKQTNQKKKKNLLKKDLSPEEQKGKD